MRYLALLALCLCAILCVTTASAGPITDSIAYQGQLTDASNSPVPDGVKDLILSIWTDSTGGTMLFSQTVAVTTNRGLFSTCIGCGSSTLPDIFTGQTLFLQTQLTGQPAMTPRTRLRSIPYAMSAASVSAEATNGTARGRGIISVKAPTGSGSLTNGLIVFDADSDGDGVAETWDSTIVTEGASYHNRGFGGVNDFNPADIRIVTTNTVDVDGDGVSDAAIRDSVVASGASRGLDWSGTNSAKIKESVRKGNGTVKITATQNSQSLRNTVSADSTAASTLLEADIDGDGLADAAILDSVVASGASRSLGWSGTDGAEVKESVRKGSGTVKITATQNSQSLRYSSSADSTAATTLLEADIDGDGNAEFSLVGVVDDTSSQLGVQRPSDGGVNHRDGWNVLQVANNTSEKMKSYFANGDVVTQEQVVEPSGSIYRAINTKGTGAVVRIGVAASDSGMLESSFDEDGDGNAEARIDVTTGSPTSTYSKPVRCDLVLDPNDDGDPDNSIEQRLTPTTSSVAINTKGTGADRNRVISIASSDSSLMEVTTDADGDGHAETRGIIVNKPSAANPSSSCLIATDPSDDGAADYSAELLSTSDSASLRLNGLPPGVPVINSISMTASATGVQVTVGGATCDGTNWINASDKNVKENFRQVDGEELLEKISELEITRWNYKSDDRIDHIGPTAQDFKETFGVGSDGKSISTIDPSGIALAAIKELNNKLNTQNSQNQSLIQENKQLRKELEELKKLVQKLASDK